MAERSKAPESGRMKSGHIWSERAWVRIPLLSYHVFFSAATSSEFRAGRYASRRVLVSKRGVWTCGPQWTLTCISPPAVPPSMSGPAATLTISPALALPDATPSLMPFHIAYSGPAPISTYFRIKSSPSPTFGRDTQPPSEPLLSPESQETSDSQATLVGSSSSVSTVGSAAAVGVDTATMSEGDATVGFADSRHYVAAFRGREMHGVLVDLPDGYAGIVLRAPDDKKGKGVASDNRRREEEKPVSKGRTTRRSKRAQEEVKVEDEEMDTAGIASEEGPTRVLEPVSTFSSFLLWHPDIPVNDGRDEYVRSLKEWTRLAAEVSIFLDSIREDVLSAGGVPFPSCTPWPTCVIESR